MEAPRLLIRAVDEPRERTAALTQLVRRVEVSPHDLDARAAVLFEVTEEGGPVLAYYLLTERPGREARIVAAAALENRARLTERVLPIIERQVRGARAISLGTHRRGLVRKLVRRGYCHRAAPRAGRFELVKALAP